MGRITHREFRTWVAWKTDQLNNPSRTDYYLMQIAGYVKHVMSKKSWSISEMKIPFRVGGPSKVEIDAKRARSKARFGDKGEED